LNLPGLPEGSAFSFEKIDNAIERGVRVRPPQTDLTYSGFVDMSGGSNDDATLAIAHRDHTGTAILDLVINQGRPAPFDPNAAVPMFAQVLKQYRCFHVVGDNFAGETFKIAFEKAGISYISSELSKSELYESFEPKLNSGLAVLLDCEIMESQFLGLVWRGTHIDHPTGHADHDDWANAVAGAVHLVSGAVLNVGDCVAIGRERLTGRAPMWDSDDRNSGSAVEKWFDGPRSRWDW
jgi:hypothetical protein